MNKFKRIWFQMRLKLGLYTDYWFGWTNPKDYGEFYDWKEKGLSDIKSKTSKE